MAEVMGLPATLEASPGVPRGPGLAADGLEAVLGAVLLDGGWRRFRATVRRLLGPVLEGLDPTTLPLEEPKSTLQELAQRRGLPLPVYRQLASSGPEHQRVFHFEVEMDGRVLARAVGSSKRAAQQAAARAALEALAEGSGGQEEGPDETAG
jgi:ribonuclease-3